LYLVGDVLRLVRDQEDVAAKKAEMPNQGLKN